MPFHIIRDDITHVAADVIVNTANPKPICASGTDRAVYEAAGMERLLEARKLIGAIAPGDVAVTPAFDLKARYIVHAVGTFWQGGEKGETELLYGLYRKALEAADELGCSSIAFPLMSTGVYGYPREKALKTALRAIRDWLRGSDMDVCLVIFDRRALEISAELTGSVMSYVDENYVADRIRREYRDAMHLADRRGLIMPDCSPTAPPMPDECEQPPMSGFMTSAALSESFDWDSLKPGETFQQMLMRLIRERDIDETLLYREASIDRRLFSKIRCRADYRPKKRTVLSLAIAMHLCLDDTLDLLARAEYALSPSSKADLIVRYFIEHGCYDLFTINCTLYECGQPTLCEEYRMKETG